MLIRLNRYQHDEPKICHSCRKRPSIGQTRCGSLGCVVCQLKVDKFINLFYRPSDESALKESDCAT